MQTVGWFKSALPVAVAGIAVLIIAQSFIGTYTLSLVVIYGILAMSLGLIWGYGGILCFGQAAFYGLGAYTYAIAAINIGESTIPFILGITVPFVIAMLLGAMMFYGRLSDVYLGVITLVVTLIFFKFMNSTAGPEYTIGTARLGGFNGIPGFQTLNVPGDPNRYIFGDDYFYFCLVVLFFVYLFLRWLTECPFGRIAVAIRENEQRVQLIGYDPRLRKTLLFSIGGAVAGLAGTMFANWAEIVTPGMFSLGQSAEIIIWCIVGGVGTLTGPFVGALVLGLLKFYLGQQSSVDNMLILGIILTATVLLLPRGIVPTLGSILARNYGRRRSARKTAGRRRMARRAHGRSS